MGKHECVISGTSPTIANLLAEWICPRCSYFNASPKSRRASGPAAVPSTPTAAMNPSTMRDSATGEGETRRRKGKSSSSGLKNEVEKDDGEVADVSNDRMEVDEEPSVANET